MIILGAACAQAKEKDKSARKRKLQAMEEAAAEQHRMEVTLCKVLFAKGSRGP